VQLRAAIAATGFEVVGAAGAQAAPGVIDALEDTDVVVLPPSNPVVSIGAILAVPDIATALRRTQVPVVGLSPIIGGAAVRGMADACLAAIGVATSADGVAQHYGARTGGGLIDGWLVDTTDAGVVDSLDAAGIATRAVPLLMHDLQATTAMAAAALKLAEVVRR
jgi:LPPG:FO 2-phospho-L-lactate transferase